MNYAVEEALHTFHPCSCVVWSAFNMHHIHMQTLQVSQGAVNEINALKDQFGISPQVHSDGTI